MKDIIITPFKTINLSHKVYNFRNRSDKYYAACSEKGIVTLLNEEFNVIKVFDCSETIKKEKGRIKFFELHPCTDVFCIGSEDEYRIYDYSGKPLCAIQERIEAIYLCEDHKVIWFVKEISREQKEICLIIDNLKTDSLIIEDEMMQSAVEFTTLPEKEKVCMTLIAGQDGMATYFLTHHNGKIIIEYIKELEENTLLDFSDNETEFLSVDPYELDKLSIYNYPELELDRQYQLPEKKEDEDRPYFGYSNFFIKDEFVITEIGENLFYILDTEKMKIAARFIVAGHEPKPVVEYWPSLKDDRGETTDLSCFYKTSDYMIAPFKAVPTDKTDNSLVVIRLNDIKEKIKEILTQ